MRAVKGKDGYLCLLCRDEATLFNNVDLAEFVNISSLDERNQHLAEEMYKRNTLRKVRRGEQIGYKIYPQQERL